MATGTAWYNLTKAASNERYNLNVVNTNLDMIDEQMHQNETEVFTGATDLAAGTVGNVPAPEITDKEKFLKGDGTWATPSGGVDMTGATASAAGTHGLVPAPSVGDNEKFLRGDGTWQTVSGGGSSTLAGLTDVNLTSPTDRQALVYDATNQKWVNGTVSGGGGSGLTATILSNTLWSSVGTYTLNDDYDNYDILEIYFCNPSVAGQESDLITVMVNDVKALMNDSKILNLTGYGDRYVNCTFSADEFTITASSTGGVQKIVGYKAGGGSGDITGLDFSDMTGSQTMDVMNKLNSGVGGSDSGIFTTGPNQYDKVEVNCGFRPTYIQVILPFSNGDTTATYDASVSTTTSTWYIPMESRTYTIDLGSAQGETGITDITDTGFKFRCNAPNTRNVQCTYSALINGQTYIQTVDFDDISATQGTDILSKLDFTNLTAQQIADLKTALGIS